jgi:hypothetical protein
MNGSPVMLSYQYSTSLSVVFASRLFVGTYRAVTAMPTMQWVKFSVQRMEASVANHEFEKARFYSIEERKERDNLNKLREKHKARAEPRLEHWARRH